MSSKFFVNGKQTPFDSREEALEHRKIEITKKYLDRVLAKGSHEHKAKILLDVIPILQKELENIDNDIKEYIEI